MSALHLIRDVAFDVTFASEEEAWEQQDRMSSFVSGRLMAAADEVFTRVAPGDNSIVRIEALEIDLGCLPAASFYDRAEERFRERLEEALRRKLRRLDSDSGGAAEEFEGIIGGTQNELDIVVRFLETGHLDWNVHVLTGRELEQLLWRAVAQMGPQLRARLEAGGKLAAIASRVQWQFSKQLARALARLVPRLALEPAGDWEIVFEEAVISGDAAALKPFWAELAHGRPELVEAIVRRQGVREDVRKAMARGFPEPVLSEIVRILEPAESGFIQEVTSRPEHFRQAAEEESGSWPETRARLWEFTLAYLLVEMGSNFNRNAYLAGMVRRMAAHYNVAYRHLLTSLIDLLKSIEASSSLKTGMLSVLSGLQQRENETDLDPDGSAFLEATAGMPQLAEGSEATSPERDLGRSILRSLITERGIEKTAGTAADRAGPEGLPPPLRELGEMAEAVEFRGTAFNRHSYIEHRIRRMAAHENLRFADVLSSLSELLEEVPLGQFGAELRSTVAELRRQAGEQAPEPDADEGDHEADAASTIADAIRSCELYDLVSACLQGRNAAGGNLIAWIEELRREYPWQLERIARACPDVKEDSPAPAGLSPEELHYLAQIGLMVVQAAAEPEAREPSDQEIEGLLARADRLTAGEVSALIRVLDRLLANPPQWFRRVLHNRLQDIAVVQTLSGLLPERQLARILSATARPEYVALLTAANLLMNAGEADNHAFKWQLLFQFAGRPPAAASPAGLAKEFLRFMAGRMGSGEWERFSARAARRLRIETSSAGAAERRRILKLLEAATPAPPRARKPVPKQRPAPARKAFDAAGHDIYIHNAGQVLAAPYLPRLFTMTGLVAESAFRDSDSAFRAIHLLQYMVDGSVQPPEHLLPLNKILCGIELDAPVKRDIDLLESEKSAVDSLLGAIIAHWTAIGKTSAQGLRESFLQRGGRLRLANDKWELLVEPRAFDMLLDRLPWGFRVTKYPWMNRALRVEWR
jgi:hypothetical protein